MSTDLVSVVENMYATERTSEEWLRQIAESIRPVLDLDELGIVAGLYSCPDPCSFTPQAAFIYGMADATQAVFFQGLGALSPTFVADSFLNHACYFGTDVRGWDDLPPVKSGALRGVGVVDSLQINAVEPDGQGCWICCPLATQRRLPDEAYVVLTRLARHLAAAHRLRRKHSDTALSSKDADAILDRNGKVRDARGVAAEAPNRDTLANAARTVDAARRRPSETPARDAIEAWLPLVAGRWTLVDDAGGPDRRLFLAVENRAEPPGVALLSPREREVVVQALRGRDNKVIAYDLGLAHSTVRVLLARAAAKIGAHSRQELLAKAGSLFGRDTFDA